MDEPEKGAAPDMASVAAEAVVAARKAMELHCTGFSSYDSKATAVMALAGRLLQWDAARMALEAARLRGKAGRAAGGA